MPRNKPHSPGWGGPREGSGRPAKEPCRTKGYYLPVRLIEKLAKKAADAGLPDSKWLARMIERMRD